jgi:5-methylcytosine-specific restriction protein A
LEFKKGEIYKRSSIHEEYGGNRQSGIAYSGKYNMIFIFTSPAGEEYGYNDRWEAGHFLYYGEGHEGDMEFSRGNEAIRTHREKHKSLHLFDKVRKGFYKYIGQMQYVDHGEEEGHDKNGKLRKVIVFRLKPID